MGDMIRPARSADVPHLLRHIRALAEFEQEPDAVTATHDDLESALFCPDPDVFAEVVDVDGHVVGMAIWFMNYSTWTGRHGLYLEDLYIEPEYRGHGYGRDLMVTLARRCVERGLARFEWSVLDWNTSAVDVYRHLGAIGMDEWTVHRLDADGVRTLADVPLRNG